MSLLDDFIGKPTDDFLTSTPRTAQAPAEASPAAESALTRAEPATGSVGAPKGKRKARPLTWERLAKKVARETNDFDIVIDMAVEIVGSVEHEARDRIKAGEFLAKFTEPNPAMTKREVTVSGPGGKAIPVAHAHLHQITLPDLSKFSAEDLNTFERLMSKAAGTAPAPRQIAARVIDVEVDE